MKLFDLIKPYYADINTAFVEAPGPAPNQGLGSTFRFGHTCGLIHGILVGLEIPVYPLNPSTWKTVMGLGRDKEASLTMARKEFPKSSQYFTLKRHHDRAEAALMSLYGYKHCKNVINLMA